MANELTKPNEVALERPSFMGEVKNEGKEHLTQADISLPRLALAQGLTPQVAEQKEGFVNGILFNSLTEKIYGKGPISFAVLRADRPRWIQFKSREDGGGILDMNVPANDPRTQWGADGKGPEATQFYDYIIVMLPVTPQDVWDNIITLSMKGANIKVARRFNALISLRPGKIFEGVYKVSSATEKNAKGIYSVYKIENAGWIPDEATWKLCQGMFTQLAGKVIDVHRDENSDDDSMASNPETPGNTDFDTKDM